MSALRPIPFAVLMCLGAFALRVGFTAWYRGGLDRPATHERCALDGVHYDELARSLAAGRGYAWADGRPTSFRPPGYPLAMAGVYALTGGSLTAVHLFFAACGALGVLGTYLFARELFAADAPARWAAGLLAVYPPDVFAASNFLSELVFGPCLAFGLWLAFRARRTGGVTPALLAGVVLGYGTLTRSFAVLLLPLFAAYLAAARPRPRAVLTAVVFAAGFVGVIAPWAARNHTVHGKFVPFTTNGGSTFYGANNPVVASEPKNYGNWVATNRLPGRAEVDAQPDEVSHDQKEYELGVAWVKAHPDQFAKLAPFKVARFWLPFVGYASLTVYPVANVTLTGPFILLILAGLSRTLATRAGRERFAACHLVLLANLVMVLAYWGDGRFRDANGPVLMAYATAGGAWLFGRLGRTTGSAVAAP